jgi:hypothetical protein
VRSYYANGPGGWVNISNDGGWRPINASQVTITVEAGDTVIMSGSVLARTTTANTAVNAVLGIGVLLDGAIQAAMPIFTFIAQNSGIGQSGVLGGTWRLLGLSPGTHTLTLGYSWNGTTNAGQTNWATNSVLVMPVTPAAEVTRRRRKG